MFLYSSRICLMKSFQYILYWQGTHSQRYVRLWHTSPSFYLCSTFFSHRPSIEDEGLLRRTQDSYFALSVRPGATRLTHEKSSRSRRARSPSWHGRLRPLPGLYGPMERPMVSRCRIPSHRMDIHTSNRHRPIALHPPNPCQTAIPSTLYSPTPVPRAELHC